MVSRDALVLLRFLAQHGCQASEEELEWSLAEERKDERMVEARGKNGEAKLQERVALAVESLLQLDLIREQKGGVRS